MEGRDITEHGQQRRIYPQSWPGDAPPEFGIAANSIKIKRIDLTLARATPFAYDFGGSILWAVRASSLAALAMISLGDMALSSDPIPFQSGMFVRGVRFSRIYVTNTAQVGEWIEFLTAVEGPDNIQIENPAASFAYVTLAPWSNVINTYTDVSIAATTTAVVLAVNLARFKAFIQSDPGNAGNVRIGDLNVVVNRGITVTPGGIIEIESTEAIYCYNPAGAAQIISVMETA